MRWFLGRVGRNKNDMTVKKVCIDLCLFFSQLYIVVVDECGYKARDMRIFVCVERGKPLTTE